MSYIVLARKFRPQNFKEIVGQEPVAQTLVNAIEASRVAHAYVFSGPRGIGKTTIARILAKCLNCEKGVTTDPCQKCHSCVSISQGSSIEDVLEIDGASNRGIEQIRELRDSAKYTPSSSRYRIFIIDEAHQITKDAFGALLKILEEPPAHVIFMMATTESQKIPAPILSRCQRFALKPIPPEKLLAHLKRICKEEKISADESSLSDIVRFVEGSLRDALSLLDQAVVYADKGVTSETLRELLGLLPKDVVRDFIQKIRNSDPVPVLTAIGQMIKDGIDLTQLGRDLQNYYHDLLLAKAGVEDPLSKDYSTMKKESAVFDFPELERNIRLLSRMLDEMRRSEAPRAVFEIYALRLAQKVLSSRELVERIEKLESGAARHSPAVLPTRPASGPARPAGGNPAAPLPPAVKTEPAKTVPVNTVPANTFSGKAGPISPNETKAEPETSVKAPAVSVANAPAVSPEAAVADPAPIDIYALWPGLMQEMGKEKQSLASALEEAEVVLEDSKLQIAFDKVFSRDLAQRFDSYLKAFFLTHLGKPVQIHSTLRPKDSKAAAESKMPKKSASFEEDEKAAPLHPKLYREVAPENLGEDIHRVLKHFPGVVKKEKDE